MNIHMTESTFFFLKRWPSQEQYFFDHLLWGMSKKATCLQGLEAASRTAEMSAIVYNGGLRPNFF